MSEDAKQPNWFVEMEEGIAWLRFDKAGASTNVLSGAVMQELDTRLQELEREKPKGLIIYSGKANGFIAGADIKEFTGLETPEQAFELIRSGQKVLDRLENLPFPTVAVINGFALGGGLELAMACRYRVALDSPRTSLGLPEVKLGIHPGFGGTVRSVRLAGVFAAMDMMLTGRSLRAGQALRAGLVDKLATEDKLYSVARQLVRGKRPPRRAPLQLRLANLAPVRPLIAGQMIKQVARKARRAHYPAPYAIIELWRHHAGDEAAMYLAEARSIAELMCGSTARNLVRVFLLQDQLKGLGRKSDLDLKHVHVVGAGVMGGDIAAWCALSGYTVTLQDREQKYIQPALDRARKLYAKKLKTADKIDAAMGRLRADVEGAGVADADVVIEAIFENLEAKQALYAKLEPVMKPGALLATNTSSIRLEELGKGLATPGRLVGLHFFNPVAKMPLVEVIHGEGTDPGAVKTALAFTRHIDRLPVPVKSAPGFLVNRILVPYMMEAILAVEEGIPLEAIDRAAENFGMPMGPVELSDTVGLDVALSVGKILAKAFDRPVPAKLGEMVDAGQLGRKSGRGFYTYENGRAVKDKSRADQATQELTDRLILPMLNEAVACLREGIVDDADLLDAGVIFGTGFAPFRGGPITYIRSEGVAKLRDRLQQLATRYGDRFIPDAGWDEV